MVVRFGNVCFSYLRVQSVIMVWLLADILQLFSFVHQRSARKTALLKNVAPPGIGYLRKNTPPLAHARSLWGDLG